LLNSLFCFKWSNNFTHDKNLPVFVGLYSRRTFIRLIYVYAQVSLAIIFW
jgi:hypothetical protein